MVETAVRDSYLLANRCRAIARYRGAFLVALQALRRSSRPLRDKIAALRFFAVTLDNYAELSKRSYQDKVCVLEEGILQRAFLLFVDSSSVDPDGRVEKYAQVIPVPDFAVFLDASAAEVLLRLDGRERKLTPRLLHLDEQSVTQVLNQGSELLRSLTLGLSEAPEVGPGIATVRVGHPDAAEKLCRDVTRLLQATR